jgi:hypothetical protein
MNPWPILVAAISSFLLGGLWYSPMLFGRAWNRESGTPPQRGHPAKVFGASLAFALVAAAAFSYIVGPQPPLERAIAWGAVMGFGIAATSFGINYQFAQRSFALWLIDGGYHTMQFVLFGVVIGAWPK